MRRIINVFQCWSIGMLVVGLCGCATTAPQSNGGAVPSSLSRLGHEVQQAIVVDANSSGGFKARLSAWQRQKNGWQQAFEPMDAVIGKNGLAPEGQKKEGDGRTPSGIYALGTAFGYDSDTQTKLPFRLVSDNDYWVDDPASFQYNQWVTGNLQAKSYEKLKRDDDLYKYAVVIDYNTSPIIPGDGSAIFLHIWRASDKPTAGCVAVSEKDILRLLRWLDASMDPRIIL